MAQRLQRRRQDLLGRQLQVSAGRCVVLHIGCAPGPEPGVHHAVSIESPGHDQHAGERQAHGRARNERYVEHGSAAHVATQGAGGVQRLQHAQRCLEAGADPPRRTQRNAGRYRPVEGHAAERFRVKPAVRERCGGFKPLGSDGRERADFRHQLVGLRDDGQHQPCPAAGVSRVGSQRGNALQQLGRACHVRAGVAKARCGGHAQPGRTVAWLSVCALGEQAQLHASVGVAALGLHPQLQLAGIGDAALCYQAQFERAVPNVVQRLDGWIEDGVGVGVERCRKAHRVLRHVRRVHGHQRALHKVAHAPADQLDAQLVARLHRQVGVKRLVGGG